MNCKSICNSCWLVVGAAALLVAGPAEAITPSITSGLIAHLDGDDVTTDGSGNVTSWNDQSVSGLNDATQGTLINQPTLVSAVTPTGADVIRFDSQADSTPEYLTIGTNTTDFDASELSWFVVFRPGAGTNNRRLTSSAYSDVDPGAGTVLESQAWGSITNISTSTTSGGYRSLARTSTGGFNAASAGQGDPPVLNVTDFFVGSSSLDTATDTVTAMLTLPDGTSFSSSNTNATLQLGGHLQTLIGAQTGDDLVIDTNGWSGDLAVFLVYDRLLSGSEIATVTEELRQAYAVPEPATFGLILLGGLAMLKRRR